MELSSPSRHIRSFVLRQGHFSAAQQQAVHLGLPRWGIAYQAKKLDLNTVFGRRAPKVLDIGFGMGDATAQIAQHNPQNDYLGIEVHAPGVGHLLQLIEEHSLKNVRLIHHDVVDVIDHMLADASIQGVTIFFPDPWPKKRHHKRRLIQAPFIEKTVKKLCPGGYLHIATDWEDYAVQILNTLTACPTIKNTVGTGFAPRPNDRPLTKFEKRGLAIGHGVWDIRFERTPN